MVSIIGVETFEAYEEYGLMPDEPPMFSVECSFFAVEDDDIKKILTISSRIDPAHLTSGEFIKEVQNAAISALTADPAVTERSYSFDVAVYAEEGLIPEEGPLQYGDFTALLELENPREYLETTKKAVLCQRIELELLTGDLGFAEEQERENPDLCGLVNFFRDRFQKAPVGAKPQQLKLALI